MPASTPGGIAIERMLERRRVADALARAIKAKVPASPAYEAFSPSREWRSPRAGRDVAALSGRGHALDRQSGKDSRPR
jgi:hypothetical protein